MGVRIVQGDCREFATDEGFLGPQFQAIITDPPYNLASIKKRFGSATAAPAKSDGATGVFGRASAGFMGKEWDTDVAFDPATWRALGDLLTPGGHVVAFGGTRTFHRLACAIEDAGFEIRDCLMWVYGTGFPKSHDVAKGIDKLDAVQARRDRALAFTAWVRESGLTASAIDQITQSNMGGHYTTAASQPAVAAREHLELMRPHLAAPVPEWVEALVGDRIVESVNFKGREVLQAGVAGFAGGSGEFTRGNPDSTGFGAVYAITAPATPEAAAWEGWGTALKPAWEPIILARKPLEGRTVAQCVLDCGTGAINVDACRVGDEGGTRKAGPPSYKPGNALIGSVSGALNGGGCEPIDKGRFPANVLHDGSDEVLAAFPANADRFFYCAKATKADRAGSKHPTVKPVKLMRWLVDLVVPPGGHVLDPFAGSGSTGQACREAGVDCTLVELTPEYQQDLRRRFAAVPEMECA